MCCTDVIKTKQQRITLRFSILLRAELDIYFSSISSNIVLTVNLKVDEHKTPKCLQCTYARYFCFVVLQKPVIDCMFSN